MIVLSLFDGMSCGQIALRDMGIPVTRYYASEIDKWAIQQTQLNFPDTVQLGDVRNVEARTLGHIDLLIGGSPCQSFSFAGKRVGMSTTAHEKVLTLARYMELKEQGFEFAGQSYLFWEYVRILAEVREANPNVLFMLENVEMGKQWEAVIDQALGVKGVHINSALVSAQVRKRIYWTNIRTFRADLFDVPESAIPQPKDRGILLKHILDDEVPDRFYLKSETIEKLLQHKQRNKANGNGFGAKFHQGGGR
jgi:DNA (cytosine-5)-methyltransferase 3A